MPLSNNNTKALFLDLHQIINEYSESTSQEIFNNTTQLIYPPNVELSHAEKTELDKLAGNPTLRTALQKIIADSSSAVLFSLFNHIDGTTDPFNGDWTGVSLVDYSEENSTDGMLHDSFLETYWEWKETRK